MKVRLGGVPVDLSPLEYRLVAYLMLRRGKAVSVQELVENVHGDEERRSNAIEVLVGRVRRKLGVHSLDRNAPRLRLPDARTALVNGVSFRLRLALTGAATIVLALAVADYGLTQLFERHVYRTLADSLDAHVREIAGVIEIDGSGAVALPRPPADPGFDAARLVQSFARGSWPTDLNLVLWRLGDAAPARLVLIDDKLRLC